MLHTDAPGEPVVTDELMGDISAALGGEPTTPEPPTLTAPDDTAPPASAPADTVSDGSPKPSSAPTDPSTAPASLSAPPSPVDLTAYSPPPGGEPLTFRLDGTPTTAEGALSFPTGKWIPNEVWDREFIPNLLGNRQAWRQERGRMDAEVRSARTQAQSEAEHRQAVSGWVRDLLAEGPDALMALAQNWETDRPLLLKDLEVKQANAKLQRYEQQEQAQQQQEREQAEQQHGFQALGHTLGDWIQQEPAFKGVPDAELVTFGSGVISDAMRFGGIPGFFYRGERGLELDEGKFRHFARRYIDAFKSTQAQGKTVTLAVARNTAAVAPTRPGVTPGKPVQAKTPARDDKGKFIEEPFDANAFLRKSTFFE